jgi:ribosomal protein L14
MTLSTSGPSILEIATGTLVNFHDGAEVVINSDAENRAKRSPAVVLDQLR